MWIMVTKKVGIPKDVRASVRNISRLEKIKHFISSFVGERDVALDLGNMDIDDDLTLSRTRGLKYMDQLVWFKKYAISVFLVYLLPIS